MAQIKKVIRHTANVTAEGERYNEFKSHIEEFDERGNRIKEIVFMEDGILETATGWKFGDDDKLLQQVSFVDLENFGERSNYVYNDEGKVEQVVIEYADGSKSIESFHKEGNRITASIKDEDGEFEQGSSTLRDERGNVIEESTLNERQEVTSKFTHEFSDKDLLLRSSYFNENGSFIFEVLYEYDEHGNPVRELRRDNRGDSIEDKQLKYNTENQLVELNINDQQIIRREYNEKGRLIKIVELIAETEQPVSFLLYHYDDEDRLTELTQYTMGEQYELEPMVNARTAAEHISIRYEYEYY